MRHQPEIADCSNQHMEDHESLQVPLVTENIQEDSSQKSKEPVDGEWEVPLGSSIFDAPEENFQSQHCNQTDGTSDVGSPGASYLLARDEKYSAHDHPEEFNLQINEMSVEFMDKFEPYDQDGSRASGALFEDSVSEGIEYQGESDLHASDSNGLLKPQYGVRSLTFPAQDDRTKQCDVNVELSPFFENETWVEESNRHFGSCSDTSNPQHDILGSDNFHNIYHQYVGEKDCQKLSYPLLNQMQKCNADVSFQISQPQHHGLPQETVDLNYLPSDSSGPIEKKNTILDSCSGEGMELQIYRKSPAVRKSLKLKGFRNIPMDSLVGSSVVELSPLMDVKPAISMHLSDNLLVDLSSKVGNVCTRVVIDEVVDRSESQLTVREVKRKSVRRNATGDQLSQKIKKVKVIKRSRRSSKAVKFDELMKTCRCISRKRRTYIRKRPRSVWGLSTAGPQTLNLVNIDTGAGCKSSKENCREKNKKNGRKNESGSALAGEADTLTTCSHLKGKPKKIADQTDLMTTISDLLVSSSPRRTECGIQFVKECGGLLKAKCVGKPNLRDAANFGAQVDHALGNLEQVELFPDALKQDTSHSYKRGDSDVDDFSRNAAQDCQASSHTYVETLTDNVVKGYLDPETSPDSEVIDIIPEATVSERAHKGLPAEIHLTSSKCNDSQAGFTNTNLTYSSRKKGKKKEISDIPGSCLLDSSTGAVDCGESKQLRKSIPQNDIGNTCSSYKTRPSLEISESHAFTSTPGLSLAGNDLDVGFVPTHSFSSLEKHIGLRNLDVTMVAGHGTSPSLESEFLDPYSDGNRPASTSKSPELLKNMLIYSDSLTNREGDTSLNGELASKDTSPVSASAAGIVEEGAWVCCDNCGKWRRIPASLADHINSTKCKWTCNENMDKAFANCSIPQEKSNQAINEELQLSECDEDADEVPDVYESRRQSDVPERSRWTSIKTNSYLHRRRKNQSIDEIMVCHCKSPLDGGLGCGEECLNRMLNIECVRGTCPCGDLCSNQQFQERKYVKLKSFKCGKKGYGLQSEEHIVSGQFLIEYVGEVLDIPAYEARQKDYASKGHKHFYFMTLSASEVIDACSKGNLGRFINHSCQPNCRTEKWMVNGEICIGLFAIRNIKKGEEITFDYNYVRVFGAAAKKCVCGSPLCQGFIGGDPLNCEVIANDSDEEEFEDREPTVVYKESGTFDVSEMIPITANRRVEEVQDAPVSLATESLRTETESLHLDTHAEMKNLGTPTMYSQQSPTLDRLSENSQLAQPVNQSIMEDVLSKNTSSYEPLSALDEMLTSKVSKSTKTESSSVTEGLGNSFQCVGMDLKTHDDNTEVDQGPQYSSSARKSTLSSSSLKKTKHKGTGVRHKKSTDENGQHEAVQEKLNELLDSGGGICKRKEAPKAYLKLLILTTASNNTGNGEAIQSNRDLSMILDALLKTKSRVVLADIINKNGLRMLHNIMKQYRRDFNRTPILRKLLKILEYLADVKILNFDHINGGAPCPGMESLAESVLALTEHKNRQVYQIARSFRDRWIQRSLRRSSCIEQARMEFHRGSSARTFSAPQNSTQTTRLPVQRTKMGATQVNGGRQDSCPASPVSSSLERETTVRKRKSTWDQDEWKIQDGTILKESNVLCTLSESLHRTVDAMQPSSLNKDNGKDESFHCQAPYMDEDVPPGFLAPCQDHLVVSSSASSVNVGLHSPSCEDMVKPYDDIVQGQPLKRFMSRSPLSYTIPVFLLSQDEASRSETTGNWEISPSLPFLPFPRLPLDPRTMTMSMSPSWPSVAMDAPQGGTQNCNPANSANQRTQKACGTSAPFASDCHINKEYTDRPPWGLPNDLGKTYFRQRKLMTPPWMRRRHASGIVQNNHRIMMCQARIANAAHGTRDHRSEDASSNNFHDH